MSGYTNKPKKLRGAFVEYGLSIPPLFVVFQFNPLQLSRSRNLSFSPPSGQCGQGSSGSGSKGRTMRQWHQQQDDLTDIRDQQQVDVQEETINLEIRLDATDKMNEGDPIASTLGVLPQLSTLELIMHPKEEGLLGAALDSLLGTTAKGFNFTKKPNPPMVLFIWGYTRVLPVNINSMSITETEFSTILSPTRATVSVNLTVIESGEPLYKVHKGVKEVTSLLNLANIADVANVVVPG
ncbi:MAG TPA: hypothetical protein VE008_11570 [Burkholderiales bacterium]|nr:hypothetical protein [Burkholderiales bacterium]